MAVNKGRAGRIKARTQLKNPRTRIWVKRDKKTGQFMDDKTSSKKPFKGIRKEK